MSEPAPRLRLNARAKLDGAGTLMAPRPHHGRVATALIGILSERGWLAGPYTVNLPHVLDELRADGGVFLTREESVRWAMAFLELTGGLEDGEDGAEIRDILGTAYDDLRARLGVDN